MADFPRRKTRLCKSCFAAGMAKSEAKREACRVAMLAKMADPEFKECRRRAPSYQGAHRTHWCMTGKADWCGEFERD